jgi:uncharacterized protein
LYNYLVFTFYLLFMRLKLKDVEFIKQTARDYFGKEAKIYLFGSRVSDHKKGGDIDLYIETNSKD